MIEIEDWNIEIRSAPTSADLRKLEKAEEIEELKIFDAAKLGPKWAAHAELFERAGITTLGAHHFGKEESSFDWIAQFPFLEELCIESDRISSFGFLEALPDLKGLAAGLERRGPVKDATLIAPFTAQLEWLTLVGKWNHCVSLSHLDNLLDLGLSYFEGDNAKFLFDLRITGLCLHESKGLDLKFLETLSNLKKLELLPLPKDTKLPDLRGLAALESVELMKTQKQQFDPSEHFGADVEIEVY